MKQDRNEDPVSYTHLDVYKRQQDNRGDGSDQSGFPECLPKFFLHRGSSLSHPFLSGILCGSQSSHQLGIHRQVDDLDL